MPEFPDLSGFSPATSFPGAAYSGDPTRPRMTSEQIEALRQRLIEMVLQIVSLALRNTLLPGPAFDQIRSWAESIQDAVADVPLIGDLVELITGIEDGDLDDLGTMFLNFRRFFEGINFLSPDFDPVAAAGEFFGLFINLIGRLLRPTWLVPISSIVEDDAVPLLLAGSFGPGSIAPNSEWVWDESVTRSADGTGSARTTGEGKIKALRSNEFEVTTDTPVAAEAFVSWQGVTASGDAFALQLVTYSGDEDNRVETGIVTLDTISSPGENSNGWQKLEGSWSPTPGVTAVRKRLLVTANVAAGRVWFDDAAAKRTGLLKQSWVQNLIGDLSSLFNWLETIVDQLLDAFGVLPVGGLLDRITDLADEVFDFFGGFLGLVDDLENAPETVVPVVGNLVGGFVSMWSSWFTAGGSPPSAPEDLAQETVEAIRAAVAGGFTLQTFTASDPAWEVPPDLAVAAEVYAGAFGGGGKGETGGSASSSSSGVSASGGDGGSSGGYRLEKVDASEFGSTLEIVVGAAATTSGANGGVTSIKNGAVVLVESVPNIGSIATPQGYQSSTSTPGRGGKGGDATTGGDGEMGEDGEPSATAAGGSGGAGAQNAFGSATADPGTAGGAGQTTILPLSGGGGGGGGGGARVSFDFTTARGGDGGNGGVPGGGSGGGGAAVSGLGGARVPGEGGNPGNGLAFLLWR